MTPLELLAGPGPLLALALVAAVALAFWARAAGLVRPAPPAPGPIALPGHADLPVSVRLRRPGAPGRPRPRAPGAGRAAA
ncbi:hypothetical protein [Bailinhaonella thermotolerans]|uniref:Uncharacterized protein n=1 Tax=Bailinhaonella thermotolerans TaxID=1070861 RepID=A0A3A4AY36_9ACTN|nr:hypothetical protein [Bailinhaonella thermotolerans]RJL34023.1 hypothetical protein D5H75_05770 [Bailinhaonella thermotolerans]